MTKNYNSISVLNENCKYKHALVHLITMHNYVYKHISNSYKCCIITKYHG